MLLRESSHVLLREWMDFLKKIAAPLCFTRLDSFFMPLQLLRQMPAAADERPVRELLVFCGGVD